MMKYGYEIEITSFNHKYYGMYIDVWNIVDNVVIRIRVFIHETELMVNFTDLSGDRKLFVNFYVRTLHLFKEDFTIKIFNKFTDLDKPFVSSIVFPSRDSS